jgi:hypothetical protein
MSRSNNTELVNPAVRFFDWSGDEGKLRYFDKTLGEKGENVDVPFPFKFLCLDRVAQIAGGIDRNGKYEGFWSNAVKNLKTQAFTVRSKQGVEAHGLYDQIKGTPGVKFMTGLYIAFYDEEGVLQIGYLKIKGAALTAWIEFTKQHRDIYTGAFGITGNSKCKKGTNTYYEPVFEHYPKVSDESDDAAKALDVHLQEYLTAYFAQKGIEEVEVAYSGNTDQAMAVAVGSQSDPQAPIGGFNPTEAQDGDDDDIPF